MTKTEQMIVDIHEKVGRIDERTIGLEKRMDTVEDCLRDKGSPLPKKWKDYAKKVGWYLVIGAGLGLVHLLGQLGISLPAPPM